MLALALLAGCGAPTAPPSDPRPDVLVLMWDTVRADRLSLYGHGRPTTPRLDAWAAGGTVYEAAWSPATWTVPAHGSLFTGLPVRGHGAHAGHRWLDDAHATLAERLSADGYQTWLFSANVFVSEATNLDQGFDAVHTTWSRAGEPDGALVAAARAATLGKLLPDDAATELSPRFAGNRAELWEDAATKDAAPVLADALIRSVEARDPDRPWFAWVDLMEAHSPRIPSARSREALLDADRRARALRTDQSLFRANAWMVGAVELEPGALDAVADTYDAALRDLDEATGDLLAALSARGALDDAVVIVVSDHGESLGEHRRLEHRWAIHEPLLHVPLVIHHPRGGFGPARVSEPVSTIDLYATVLDLARSAAAPPPTSRSLRSSGDRGAAHAELAHAWASRLAGVHRAWPDLDLSGWDRTYVATRRGSAKLVLPSDGPPALYDLAADPGETRDLAAERPAEVTAMLEALRAWSAALPAVETARSTGEPTAAERAQLEILGYVDDGG